MNMYQHAVKNKKHRILVGAIINVFSMMIVGGGLYCIFTYKDYLAKLDNPESRKICMRELSVNGANLQNTGREVVVKWIKSDDMEKNVVMSSAAISSCSNLKLVSYCAGDACGDSGVVMKFAE